MPKSKPAKSDKKKAASKAPKKKGVELDEKDLDQVSGGFEYGATQAAQASKTSQKIIVNPTTRTGGALNFNKG